MPSQSVDASFLEEFTATLREQHLEQVLGLCSVDGEPRHLLEVTEGDANITFSPPGGKSLADIDHATPAAWVHWNGEVKMFRRCFQMHIGPYEAHTCNHVSPIRSELLCRG